MDYKLRIKKFRDPNKGNWETTLSGGYENISGKIYDIKQYKEPDKIKDANGNPTDSLANNGYYSGKGELINLINPFTNPATNAKVTVEKIEADFEDFYGWGNMMGRDQYFAYIAKSISTNLEKKYKELFGIEISLTPEPLPEKPKETPPPTTAATEKTGASPGVVAKYISTGASNNGVPLEITYEMVKDGISLVKKEKTTGFKYDEKTKKITISASETFYDASGKWVDSNGKDQFATKDQVFTLEGYPPVDPATAATSGTAGTSGEAGPKIYGEFTIDVRQQDIFFTKEFGTLEIIMKGVMKQEVVEEPAENTEDALAEEEPDEYAEELFEGADELIVIADFKMQQLTLENPEPTPESTARVDEAKIDFNNASFVGDKWKSFDIEKLISNVDKKYGPSSQFKDSLKKVLYFIKNDSGINDVRKAAYMLGTAFAESGYSLQRWEADYACGSTGIKYGSGGPCSSATNYYRSTKGGKKNYYNLGTDSKGFPYFGRGLIQLTGKANYESYGKKIGVNLVGNGDLAMDPQNSYKIAAEFLKSNTFSKVISGDLTRARKSVNGGTKGLAEVNGAYNAWLAAFKKIGAVS
jgi:hypothetical protein